MESEKQQSTVDQEELRRGPWTVEEDLILTNYISKHGEGRWNSLAKCAGLKRTGKSCRLRWLNYLRPDVRRGNITREEQLLILELHSRWGNRWSKIAQHLPGRTDNEIKNYWRTRVQKNANQQWMPSLLERIRRTAIQYSSSTINSTIHTNFASSNDHSRFSSPGAVVASCCNDYLDERGGAGGTWAASAGASRSVGEEIRWHEFPTTSVDDEGNMLGIWELSAMESNMYV